ncbi:hypothetical protein [Variovorax saccharolyticus]|uniref:hypothetical protein n=1 Tax=Variovorax saccharolyticus TaxID=3053516 RepID=UPI0025767B6D|nr:MULTISPECIES: hypothetical protein [unclassified Variovorax]MDM0022283.1 hypothetical protein [Variovorax sp. J22R187]MDM0028839.1 hypothetical protein [Variovorax sp. J31P216]
MIDQAARHSQPFAIPPFQRSTRPSPCIPALLQPAEVTQYRQMEAAFRASGGIVSADEVVSMLNRHTDQPISQLARWIVDHRVLSFQWRSGTKLPLFQFDLPSMVPRSRVVAVISELVPALSDWEVCLWLVTPNAWLAEAKPFEELDQNASAVIDAARAERYLLRG